MSTYLSDAEQIEKLRKWWKEYGWATILGVALAIILVVGWQVYQRYKLHQAQHASLVYATMMSSSYDGDMSSAKAAANDLIKQFHGTSYADIANLWLAKQAATASNYDQALTYLETVEAHGHMSALRQIAALRRAEIYIQLKQNKLAMTALATTYDKGFTPRIDELKGDVYWQMKDFTNAKTWYQQAQQAYDKAGLPAPMLSMKLADVPDTVTANNKKGNAQ